MISKLEMIQDMALKIKELEDKLKNKTAEKGILNEQVFVYIYIYIYVYIYIYLYIYIYIRY